MPVRRFVTGKRSDARCEVGADLGRRIGDAVANPRIRA